MNMRTLGTLGVPVSPIMLGGNVFGWNVDEQASFTILDRWADRGFNFIDTADVYSRWIPGNKGGESESILGKWLKKSGKREEIVLATKVGMDMGDGKKGLKAAYIKQAVEASLRRLQTDYIDLYQSHWDDPDTPVQETLEAYDELVRAGKVRVIGASNFSASTAGASKVAAGRPKNGTNTSLSAVALWSASRATAPPDVRMRTMSRAVMGMRF